MIKFIYFDLGGVVINNYKAHEELAKQVNAKQEDVYNFFRREWKGVWRGEVNNAEYLRRLKDEFHAYHLSDDILTIITQAQGHYQETHELINELASTYTLGILSNAELGIVDVLLAQKKIPNITWHTIIESAQHKTIKPEARIYEIAERLSGVAPEEIFFIDDVPKNIEAAKNRGWHGVVFDTKDIEGSVSKIKKKLKDLKK